MVRTRPLTALLVAPAAALLLLLSGCAEEEPEPKFADEPSATPTVEEEETAEEFIKRWAKAERDMQNTGETAEYRAMSVGCESCDRLATRVEGIYAAKGRISTEGMTIVSVDLLDHAQYLLWARNATTSYTETGDSPEQSYPGGKAKYLVKLERRGDSFVLSNFEAQPL